MTKLRYFEALATAVLISACTQTPDTPIAESGSSNWKVDFFDDFNEFNPENWQDQLLWVNSEDQCYLRNGKHSTREVSDGTLKLRVVDLGEKHPCENRNKIGVQHPDTRYVAGRITSKNRKEFVKGRWTARLRVPTHN